MRDLLPQIRSWQKAGKAVAVATVVKVWGSAPRPIGSAMAITDAGDMAGSVSGGCVEGAVYEEAQGVLQDGSPRLVSFGVSDEDAWAVGLSCGGQIDVYVEALPAPDAEGERADVWHGLLDSIEREELVVLATVVAGDAVGRQVLLRPEGGTFEAKAGALGEALDEDTLHELAHQALPAFASKRHALGTEDTPLELFVAIHPPRPRLIIVGAVHVAIPLVHFAQALGFRVEVVDPRTAFATPERFPHADGLHTDWPDEALRKLSLDENTFLALLSHDLKLDIPALEVALPSPARYIGALGSKKTHGKREKALEERGIDAESIARIHNPIGLNLGGRRAEEIALAVAAEMVAVSHGRS